MPNANPSQACGSLVLGYIAPKRTRGMSTLARTQRRKRVTVSEPGGIVMPNLLEGATKQATLFAMILSGVAWTIVYVESIRVGFKEKTYAMPLFALALNIAWEALYAYVGFARGVIVQHWINLVWFLLDCVIVYTYFKYGREEFSERANPKYFVPFSILVFAMSAVLQVAFRVEYGNLGAAYSAFIQNLMMSVLYIDMLHKRQSTKGQSLTIAISKWIGTLAPTILFGAIGKNQLMLILGIFCSVFDLIYIVELRNFAAFRSETWRRPAAER